MDQSNTLVGQRLPDIGMGDGWPDGATFDELPAGSYWKMLNRKTGEPLNVHTLADQAWWNNTGVYDTRFDQNLTGTVWGYKDPNGNYGMMCVHTVREEEDGTISVRPGDGSSNSILNEWIVESKPELNVTYHGYIEHGVWSSC